MTEPERRAAGREAGAKRLRERAKVDEDRAQFLKERLKEHFLRHGKETVETRRYRITHAMNGGCWWFY